VEYTGYGMIGTFENVFKSDGGSGMKAKKIP
jgi:hypothetical protein